MPTLKVVRNFAHHDVAQRQSLRMFVKSHTFIGRLFATSKLFAFYFSGEGASPLPRSHPE